MQTGNKNHGTTSSNTPTPKEKDTEKRASWREHKNPMVRYFAKFSYTVWLVVMVVGGGLAIIIALALL